MEEEKQDFTNFVKGLPISENYNSEWLNSVRKWVSENKKIERIRVVSPQLTDYEKFEFQQYHENSKAGEKIRVLARSEYEELCYDELLNIDFWI